MILLVDNYDSFTYNLVQRLGELDPSLEPGRDLVVIRNDRVSAASASALDDGRGPTHVIISPGPCTPTEAGASASVIERFAGRVPVLGVCLGHQTMAHACGMVVERHAVPVHGKTSPVRHDGRGVFAGLSDPFEATRYHSLVVRASTVPPLVAGEDGWEVTAWADEPVDDLEPVGASSAAVAGGGGGPQGGAAVSLGGGGRRRVVMGLRRVWAQTRWADGSLKQPVEGVQFHPESFMTIEGPRLLANFLAMGPGGRRVPESRISACIGEGAAAVPK